MPIFIKLYCYASKSLRAAKIFGSPWQAVSQGIGVHRRSSAAHHLGCGGRELPIQRKPYWPPMNADERRYDAGHGACCAQRFKLTAEGLVLAAKAHWAGLCR